MAYMLVIGMVRYRMPNEEGEDFEGWDTSFVRERVIAHTHDQALKKALFAHAEKLGDVNTDFDETHRLSIVELSEAEYMRATKQPMLFD